jgi:4-diphosphocytidyl-2-C-methyl-D-erythritol kinase
MMRVRARAKINWTLDVVGKRSDGYHLLDTLMQSVELYDTLTFEPCGELEFITTGAARVPSDENNLVCKAMNLLAARTGVTHGVRVILRKRIPIGGGMGGGSADAAATLAGLNRFWRLGLREDALRALGAEVGADVPFCLVGGLSRATGIGEKLEKLPSHRPAYLVVIQPCRGLSTREIFQLFSQDGLRPNQRPMQEDAVAAAREGDLRRLCRSMGNALQPAAIRQRPEIAQAIQALEMMGAIRAQMTGSGSAVFGVFETAYGAQRAWESLSPIWGRCWTTRTASRSLVFRGWMN